VETEREKLRQRSFTSRYRNAVETELESCANVRHFTFQEKAGFTAVSTLRLRSRPNTTGWFDRRSARSIPPATAKSKR
jgi:hypothetical protein